MVTSVHGQIAPSQFPPKIFPRSFIHCQAKLGQLIEVVIDREYLTFCWSGAWSEMTLIRSFFFFGIFELAFFFPLFFSGKVCYEGNGNSRHPAITSKINQLLQFNNFFTKLQKCRAPVKPASNQISSPSQAETSQHQFTTIYLPSVLLDGKTAGFLQIIS